MNQPRPQSGILPAGSSHARFLTFTLRADADMARVRAALSRFATQSDEVAALAPEAQLYSTLAIGSEDWSRIYPHARPAQLKAFPQFPDSVIPLPHTPSSAFVHIRSERHDLNFELARRLAAALEGLVDWHDDVHGFRYLDTRDLTGFVDGTENPEGDERAEVALTADDAPFDGGSYVHIQRYVHNLQRWRQQPVAEQEAVMGRTRDDNIEIDDEIRPPTAHISRVVIEEDGAELAILRHSLPWGGLAESGLYFVSYAASPQNFTRMLAMMFRRDGHGHYDHLLNFTRPLSGAAFFAPSRDWLEQQG